MMNKLEEAIIYATIMHQGKIRKFGKIPYILHSLEVAQILSTMTEDEDVITAGILHDIVEDTDGTMEEIKKRFGERVAALVASETENKYPNEDKCATWKRRKEDSLLVLKNSRDMGVKMLWLGDKLSNIRSLARVYSEQGNRMWKEMNQSDPAMHCWYYRSVAEILELSLNKTGAFKELIKHINSIWPGTFDSDKARYKKYREVSVEGCKLLGRGAKGDVYRYDDELVIKVYNDNNTYSDVEKEIAQSRKAFILGLPTAISFGIVAVGNQYGAMYELMNAETVSECIARNPGQVESYGRIMADLARNIHGIEVTNEDGFPSVAERLCTYIQGGVGRENHELAEKCLKLIHSLPERKNLVHGDFHSGNVFMHGGEPYLIDMDRVAMGHPIAEIADLYYFYVVLGEKEPSVVEKFMGFSYDTAKQFFETFLKTYLETEDVDRLQEVTEKASLLCYARMVNKLHKKDNLSERERELSEYYMKKVEMLVQKLDTLEF